jgi:hypothetical protein
MRHISNAAFIIAGNHAQTKRWGLCIGVSFHGKLDANRLNHHAFMQELAADKCRASTDVRQANNARKTMTSDTLVRH